MNVIFRGDQNMGILEQMRRTGLVPVVVLEKKEDAIRTAKALLAGDIDLMEITFRTDAAEDSIREVTQQVPGMTVGAGTVLTVDQAERAVAAGAQFIVSPGFDEDVVNWCIEKNIPIIPGCVTPTEIMRAMAFGLKTVKFFPANIYGGLPAMKALSAPFPGISFVPTGGVDQENMESYLSESFILAVGGSWLCTKKDIASGQFEKITELAQAAHRVAIARQ